MGKTKLLAKIRKIETKRSIYLTSHICLDGTIYFGWLYTGKQKFPMDAPETLSTFEFFQKFPNEESARKFLENRHWSNEPVCGHCGSVSVTECKNHKPMPYRCRDCCGHFSVRTGTVLAESRLPLKKCWQSTCSPAPVRVSQAPKWPANLVSRKKQHGFSRSASAKHS